MSEGREYSSSSWLCEYTNIKSSEIPVRVQVLYHVSSLSPGWCAQWKVGVSQHLSPKEERLYSTRLKIISAVPLTSWLALMVAEVLLSSSKAAHCLPGGRRFGFLVFIGMGSPPVKGWMLSLRSSPLHHALSHLCITKLGHKKPNPGHALRPKLAT